MYDIWVVKDVPAREFLLQIRGIPSFANLGIPDYTEAEWRQLSPIEQITQAIAIRGDREGWTLDTRISDNEHYRFALSGQLCWFFNDQKYAAYREKDFTWREYFAVWESLLGENWAEVYVQNSDFVWIKEPYFHNNFRSNLEFFWYGEPRMHYSKKLSRLLESYKKKTGWPSPPYFGNSWDNGFKERK